MRQCFCAGLHDADAGRSRESAPDGHQESAEAPPRYYGIGFGSLWVAVACGARWLRAQRPTGLLAGSQSNPKGAWTSGLAEECMRVNGDPPGGLVALSSSTSSPA